MLPRCGVVEGKPKKPSIFRGRGGVSITRPFNESIDGGASTCQQVRWLSSCRRRGLSSVCQVTVSFLGEHLGRTPQSKGFITFPRSFFPRRQTRDGSFRPWPRRTSHVALAQGRDGVLGVAARGILEEQQPWPVAMGDFAVKVTPLGSVKIFSEPNPNF